MTNFGNRVSRSVLCVLIAASATLTTVPGIAAPAYDGTWSLLVVTEKGTCDVAYRYPIRIANGTLVNAGDAAFTVSGKVAQTGAITVTVSAGGKSATGFGRLAGTIGTGSWSGGACSGSWTAERRGA